MVSFETDPQYQKLLDWAEEFVREEVEPLDHVFANPYDRSDEEAVRAVRPLKRQVREKGLWACHLPRELGGGGYGQVKLALLNEILGRSAWAPTVFGCQAPDSGNAEILAHYGTDEQRARHLQPLLDGETVSCYAMTEPQAGAEPRMFTCRAERDGTDWVLNGEKWFASNARFAAFTIVMVVTDPSVPIHRGASMFLVPAGTPGVEIVRNVGVFGEDPAIAAHAYVRYDDVRLPAQAMLGPEGGGFEVAQVRLGGGRVHHAMRAIGSARKAFDLMCERALSRLLPGGTLADLSTTKERIAQSWLDIEQFRLLVLRTAWLIDKHNDYAKVRGDIAAVKAAMPEMLHRVARRSLHLHGSLGVTPELPLGALLMEAEWLALADGPTEVHEATLAKRILRDYQPAPDLFPSAHLPRLRQAALAKYPDSRR
ncbi:acyl-CoA dehydrogenase [Streptomyces canus]|uniref:Acyl-CoA dehydrogenase n=1 Tax=Streptomyces canus TaxID=58343 RepID=A0A117QW44_9ACTN|nr:acyl-CoA dehydrogenase family protein [Streptomyces canus]KUN57416.1 acyl-CoA dehydrogenase [Streptomyces canus]